MDDTKKPVLSPLDPPGTNPPSTDFPTPKPPPVPDAPFVPDAPPAPPFPQDTPPASPEFQRGEPAPPPIPEPGPPTPPTETPPSEVPTPEEQPGEGGPPTGEAGLPPVITPPSTSGPKAKIIASIIGLVLLVVSIPAGIILVQRQQEIRERAATSPASTVNCDEIEDAFLRDSCRAQRTATPTPTPTNCDEIEDAFLRDSCRAQRTATPTPTPTPTPSVGGPCSNECEWHDARCKPGTTNRIEECKEANDGDTCSEWVTHPTVDCTYGCSGGQCLTGTSTPSPTATLTPTPTSGAGNICVVNSINVYKYPYASTDLITTAKVGDQIRFVADVSGNTQEVKKVEFLRDGFDRSVQAKRQLQWAEEGFYKDYTLGNVSQISVKARCTFDASAN